MGLWVLEILNKKISIRSLIVWCIIILTFVFLFVFMIKLLENLPKDKDRIDALIGLSSSVLGMILSAVVAYLVASYQLKAAKRNTDNTNKNYEKLLLYELQRNRETLTNKNNLVENKSNYLNAVSMLLSFEIWDSVKDKVSLEDGMIEPVFKSYHFLNVLKAEKDLDNISEEEFPKVVKRTEEKMDRAVSVLSKKFN